MKIMNKRIAFTFLMAIAMGTVGLAQKQQVDPAVPGFGAIDPMPESVYRPDPSLEYKIVVDVVAGGEADERNSALWNLARMLNLHVEAGVPQENLHVVAVIHGGATATVLNNEAYQAAKGTDNPNLEMMQALHDAGVQFYVCGQSLNRQNWPHESVQDIVTVAFSALTTLTEHQLKGYALLTFR